jgi:hypothetical protein
MPLSKTGGREVVRAGRAAAVDAAGEDEDEGEGCTEEASSPSPMPSLARLAVAHGNDEELTYHIFV